jgi:hypothetical protein
MGTIYFFPSGNVTYNDKVIPVILELARQGNTVHTIILSKKTNDYIGIDGSYFAWLDKYTRISRFISTERLSLVDKLVLGLRVMYLWVQMRVKKGYVALFDSKGPSPITSLLSKVANNRGTSVLFTPNYVDTWKDELNWDVAKNNTEFAVRIGKSSDTRKRKREYKEYSKILSYNHNLVGHEGDGREKQTIVLSNPKLQRWWNEFVVSNPPENEKAISDLVEPWVTVLLSHRSNYIFRDDSDLDALIPEILSSVRKIFPDATIVIKPKRTLIDKKERRDWFYDFMKDLNLGNVVITDMPVSLLSANSLIAISTGHTTAQFEFMGTDAPWIDYCRYSDLWKQMYPKVTYTEEYGGFLAEQPNELEELLIKTRDGELKSDLGFQKDSINFEERDISFELFAE